MMDDALFMMIALEEARKAFDKAETPVGAIVVKDGEVIARAHNLRETLQDPTAHAEIIAIKDASQILGRWRLTDCSVYVTLEPCAMCAGAMVLARIQRLVYGTSDPKSGAVGSLMNLLSDERLNHKVDVESGVLAKECGDILSDFFSSRRKKICL
jgi:tRNA(adenine34) deaminase